MRAGDLAASLPTVTLSTAAIETTRVLAGLNLPGLIVVECGRPVTILPGSQVLWMAVPQYCQEDLALARAVDEAAAALLLRGLGDRRGRFRPCLRAPSGSGGNAE